MVTHSVKAELFERCLDYCTGMINGTCKIETICRPSFIDVVIIVAGFVMLFALIYLIFKGLKEQKEKNKQSKKGK